MLKLKLLSPNEIAIIGSRCTENELKFTSTTTTASCTTTSTRSTRPNDPTNHGHTSAGFVCYYITPRCRDVDCKNNSNNRQAYVLLLRNKGGFWDFPKGAVEMVDNNNLMRTAFRELLEETSLTDKDVKTLHKDISFSYEYYVHGRRLKRVKLFLAELKERVMYKTLYYDGTEIFTHRFVELQDLHTYFFWKEDVEVSNTIRAHLNDLIEQS